MHNAGFTGKSILLIDFFVAGVPYAKQSFRALKNGHMYQTKNVKAWQKSVSSAAGAHYQGEIYDQSIKVILDFHIKHDADVDNLAKAVLDGLEGIVFKNDRKVVVLIATKTKDQDVYGVRVRISNVF